MKRVQLFEFEDQAWFPSIWRSTMTKIIVVLHKLLKTEDVIADLLKKARESSSFNSVVDLGSGAGGAMPMAIAKFNNSNEDQLSLKMTDLHPNQAYVDIVNKKNDPMISYESDSIDATHLENAPDGLKTMVNSFHHMPPNVAKKILGSAQNNRQPILIYEMGENMVPLPIWFLLLPISLPLMVISALLFVPFVKPLKFTDLLFSWLIPVVPLFYAWDGQASGPRTYTFKDIDGLLPAESDQYTWTVEHALKANNKKLGYYILGLPKP